jgi:hypothetical protein
MRPRNSVDSVIGRFVTSTTPTAGGPGERCATAGDKIETVAPAIASAAMNGPVLKEAWVIMCGN